jgi:hypothetical protein
MTKLRDFELESVFEVISDRASLELVQRVIQAEVTFHESRLTQLKQVEQAIGKRVQTMK